jgi:3-hydroxyacyl-[acyl-carrier-protein] dehydratase
LAYNHIINRLPYNPPFLFVDNISYVDETGATGNYTFMKDSFFYEGHFKDNPITPGVILTECMAQIGVVCLGIHLLDNEPSFKNRKETKIALSSTAVDFFLPVLPGEEVKVVSEKLYFRFNKLKCKVEMFNSEGELVCRGEIAGMIG